jgi:DNA-binding transcriptional regulator LsrR (DeoR family)
LTSCLKWTARSISPTGNLTPDGSAAFHNAISNLADKVKARAFPMPPPVFATSRKKRDLLHQQPMIRTALELAVQANVTFLGIGELNDEAPPHEDGFCSQAELKLLQKGGGVGEIVCWSYDREGRIINGLITDE